MITSITFACAVLGLVSCSQSSRESSSSAGQTAQRKPPAEASVDGADLAMLAGSWEGELEYLDFGDNKKKSTIKASVRSTYSAPARRLSIAMTFTEPSGKLIEDQDSFEIGAGGRQILFDQGEWFVTHKETEKTPETLTIGFERDGTDNNQNARLRNTITLTGGNQFAFIREVRYPDSGVFFTRSTYRFSRTAR